MLAFLASQAIHHARTNKQSPNMHTARIHRTDITLTPHRNRTHLSKTRHTLQKPQLTNHSHQNNTQPLQRSTRRRTRSKMPLEFTKSNSQQKLRTQLNQIVNTPEPSDWSIHLKTPASRPTNATHKLTTLARAQQPEYLAQKLAQLL